LRADAVPAPAPVAPEATPEAERPPARRACVVLLGGRPFAVDVTEAREVVVVDATTPVPGAPPALLGVVNLRGAVLPVVEARPLLGLPVRRDPGPGRALVVADGGRRAAVLIERVLGLTAFDDVRPLAAERAGLAGLALGEVAGEGALPATLLDARALLAAVRGDPNLRPGPAAPATVPGA
jgi:purine-binding chemotaxis protein CheW